MRFFKKGKGGDELQDFHLRKDFHIRMGVGFGARLEHNGFKLGGWGWGQRWRSILCGTKALLQLKSYNMHWTFGCILHEKFMKNLFGLESSKNTFGQG